MRNVGYKKLLNKDNLEIEEEYIYPLASKPGVKKQANTDLQPLQQIYTMCISTTGVK